MITFKEFLKEQQQAEGEVPISPDAFVFTFGRYNPPTKGHISHFRAVRWFARSNKSRYAVFVSSAVDTKSNPIPVTEKITYIKKAMPALVVEPARNVTSVLERLARTGKYKKFIFFAGSDHFTSGPEQVMLERLAERASKMGLELEIKNSGQRTAGVSASALRQAVANNDFKAFLRISPVGVGNVTEGDVSHMFELTKRSITSQPTKSTR